MLDGVFLSVSGISSVFAMPVDPAVLNKRPKGLVLTAADLLNPFLDRQYRDKADSVQISVPSEGCDC